MLRKINVLGVVSDHLKTLRNHKTDKLSFWDFVLMLVIPVSVAVILPWCGSVLSPPSIGILVTVFAVFAGLLFNLLMIVYDMLTKNAVDTDEIKARKVFLREVYTNVSFCILLSIGILILLLATYAVGVSSPANPHLSGTVFYFSGVFFLSLLMVLRRVHALLKLVSS